MSKDIPTADILEWCKERNYALVAREDFPYLFKDIVKCGECKRSGTDGENTFCMWLGALRKPTDFCSYGKREAMSIINDILKWCTWSKTYHNMWEKIICEMLIEGSIDGRI